ncbi:MAG TPA: FIST N-terminal domain-containing protein [Candidatus Dormibacteraeota bacterium]|nr:FIST N-terminal domain-containing protein [Candidatus Dormibacteraeota bacterium]
MVDTGPRRWMRVGRSAAGDARSAGEEAAGQALEQDKASLLVVFCSDAYDLELLIRTISERSGGAPLIGCSTAGEIGVSGPGDSSVVVTALGGEGFSIATALATGASGRLRLASAEVAASVSRLAERPHKVLMLLSDGLSGDQQEVVRGAYSVVGAAVPLVGGCAGDDLKMKRTYQFHGTQVVTDAVVGAAIASDSPMGIGVRHGWRRVGEPMLVTGSADNRVHTLDDKPALDIYLDRLNAPASARTDAAAFTRFAITHPLGLSRRSGEEVRFVGEANFEDRSLICIAGVPQGGLAWFMEGDDTSVLEATDAACSDALASLDGHRPVGFLAFDCIARRGVLGDEGIRREVSRIGLHAGGAPIAGFYTYGEIARTNGVSGFHNQTLVILALS